VEGIDDAAFAPEFGAALAGSPARWPSPFAAPARAEHAMLAATGTSRSSYRQLFDPACIRAKGSDEVSGWGGGAMNGAARLTVDNRRVDVH